MSKWIACTFLLSIAVLPVDTPKRETADTAGHQAPIVVAQCNPEVSRCS